MMAFIREAFAFSCVPEKGPKWFRIFLLFLTIWISILLLRYFDTPHLVVKFVNFGDSSDVDDNDYSSMENIKPFTANKSSATLLSHACNFPDLDPWDPEVIKAIKEYPPINCEAGRPNLVIRSGDLLKVRTDKIPQTLAKGLKFKECKYKTVVMKPKTKDRETTTVFTSKPFTESIPLRHEDEHFIAECFDTNSTVISRSYFAVIRVKNATEKVLEKNYEKHIAKHNPKETLSVLVLGIDGMSRQNFIRGMPNTRNFILEKLKAIELYKYNKIDDNTFPNVMPLLTGNPTKENTYRNGKWTREKPLDVINKDFLWSEYRNAGYRTGMMLDRTGVTAFHYLKKGWDKSPVDYYLRPAAVESEYDTLMRSEDKHCIGDMPEITLFHDYWVQLASTFNNTKTKPYFGYSFAVRLTHDKADPASAGDELHYKFLKELVDKNVLNNTVIVYFSDHGARFGRLVSTYNGKIERKTPYIFFIFPPWFHQKYPHLIKVLKINQDRLTTHFDVHETLRDLLYFKGETGKGNIKDRGISLFKEIPVERTCAHAQIPVGYCACMVVKKVKLSSTMSKILTSALISKINAFVEEFRQVCVTLTLKSVQSSLEVTPSSSSKERMYQLSVVTSPNDGLYEATLGYSKGKSWVISDVIRLNMYRGQAECINDPKLRQYCFCNNLNATNTAE